MDITRYDHLMHQFVNRKDFPTTIMRCCREMYYGNFKQIIQGTQEIFSIYDSNLLLNKQKCCKKLTTKHLLQNWASGRQRQQEVVVREVEKLCQGIQALTRAANPLGKLIDFLQEDIDSMQTELETWISTNLQLGKQLQQEEQ